MNTDFQTIEEYDILYHAWLHIIEKLDKLNIKKSYGELSEHEIKRHEKLYKQQQEIHDRLDVLLMINNTDIKPFRQVLDGFNNQLVSALLYDELEKHYELLKSDSYYKSMFLLAASHRKKYEESLGSKRYLHYNHGFSNGILTALSNSYDINLDTLKKICVLSQEG